MTKLLRLLSTRWDRDSWWLLRLYRWHELGVVGSIALGLHYIRCSQLYKSGILNGIRILNSSVWRPQLHYIKYVAPDTGQFKAVNFFLGQRFLICFKTEIVKKNSVMHNLFCIYVCEINGMRICGLLLGFFYVIAIYERSQQTCK